VPVPAASEFIRNPPPSFKSSLYRAKYEDSEFLKMFPGIDNDYLTSERLMNAYVDAVQQGLNAQAAARRARLTNPVVVPEVVDNNKRLKQKYTKRLNQLFELYQIHVTTLPPKRLVSGDLQPQKLEKRVFGVCMID
jgi:hypothetical protein